MKKIITFVIMLFFIFPVGSQATYSQNDIHTAINKAFAWMETNASPLNAHDSAASDYYIMALSRMGKSYDYAAYVSITENRNPSTKQDGQRLVMSNTACGEKLADSFVGIYTYNTAFESASDIAGAIITLKSCGYEIKRTDYSFDNLLVELLQKQQSNGSFNNDVLTTAKSLLALSFFPDMNYNIPGEREGITYTYSTKNAILNAVTYLTGSLSDEYGYSTVTAAAYTIIALDAVGIDADNDVAFSGNGKSLLGYLLSMQGADGSFGSSSDDTAIASCALASHILSMQGKTSFFKFNDSIKADTPLDGENHSGTGIISDITNTEPSEGTNANNTVTVTPPPAYEPEHSGFEAEDYGPYPFVGPVKSETDTDVQAFAEQNGVSENSNTAANVTVIIIMVICAAGIIFIFINKRYPHIIEKAKSKLKSIK